MYGPGNTVHTYISTYTHMYIPWINKCVINTVACGTSHKYTNIQIYSVQYYEHLQKQCYKSPLHIQNLTTELKQCVCGYFLNSLPANVENRVNSE